MASTSSCVVVVSVCSFLSAPAWAACPAAYVGSTCGSGLPDVCLYDAASHDVECDFTVYTTCGGTCNLNLTATHNGAGDLSIWGDVDGTAVVKYCCTFTNAVDPTVNGELTVLSWGFDDVIGLANIHQNMTTYVDSGAGQAIVTGSAQRDEIHTGQDQDQIHSLDGDDIIYSDGNADDIYAGAGIDLVHAGAGDDFIDGGDDGDTLYGDQGGDDILGGTGVDVIHGGPSYFSDPDTVDRVCGGSDNDTISGDDDNDQLFGGTGTDTIDGGGGTDACENWASQTSCNSEQSSCPI